MEREINEIEHEIENKRLSASNRRWIRQEQDFVRARLLRRLARHRIELTTLEIERAAKLIFEGRLASRLAQKRREESVSLWESCQKLGPGALHFDFPRFILRHKMRMNMRF